MCRNRNLTDFWVLVRELPRRQAQVVALTYVYGLTVSEVATTLGVGAGTVKTHLFRARATLSRQLGLPEGRRRDGELDGTPGREIAERGEVSP